MPLFELNLTGFRFPKDLPNDRANFRFVADLRYIDHRKQFKTVHAVMPSLDTFWECDKRRTDRPNHVRAGDEGSFDMERIDVWERLVFLLRAEAVHSIQFKVLDVNRRDAWDAVKDLLGGVIEAAVGGWKKDLRKEVSGLEAGALGAAGDDVQSFLLKKLAGATECCFGGQPTCRPRSGSTAVSGSRTAVRSQSTGRVPAATTRSISC